MVMEIENTEIEQQQKPQRPVDANGNPIYRVPEQNLEGLKARVAKINKRAAKLGMEPLVVTEIGEEYITRKKQATGHDANGNQRYVEYQIRIVLATVTGKCPKVNGWMFVATIEHEEAGNILRVAPKFETVLPLTYRTATTACDHCSKTRIRKDTYILQSETGEWKQVGRNCLADFLRTENPAGMAEWAELIASLDSEVGEYEDESFGGDGGHKFYFRLDSLLARVTCCVRHDGWCSRGEARNSFIPKSASVDQALNWFDHKWVGKQRDEVIERYTPTEEDKQKAADAIAWAQSIAADVTNDFLWNVRVVSHRESVDYRNSGIAGAIVIAYQKHMEAEIARKYERDHPSEYFGEVGKREIFTLTVIGIRELESDYGVKTMIRFRQTGGNKAVWFAAGCPSGFGLDSTVVVKATVKAHEEYKGHKQTQLSRVSVYDAEMEAAQKAHNKAQKKIKKSKYTCDHEPKIVSFMPWDLTVLNRNDDGEFAEFPLNEYVICCEACQAAWMNRRAEEGK